MKHLRSDYNERIQDSANLIPDEEPVFVIRGQDPAAPGAVEAWATLAEYQGASSEIVASARKHAEAMRAWQAEHGTHVADLPSGASS